METNPLITIATTYSGLCCPRCGCNSYRKFGHSLGIQRYRCKKCNRCFNETINTPLHWIHNKPKMMLYAGTLPEHLSIKKTASRIGISASTSFAWRHKILSSFMSLACSPASAPSGACQITMPRSYKGKRVIPDKPAPASRTILVADARGIPCLQKLPDKCSVFKVSQILSSCISASASVACRPSHLLSHAVPMAGCPSVLHHAHRRILLAKVRSVQAQLEFWMERFNGVATKYLQQYWNWFRAESCLSRSPDTFVNECFAHRRLMDYRMIRAV